MGEEVESDLKLKEWKKEWLSDWVVVWLRERGESTYAQSKDDSSNQFVNKLLVFVLLCALDLRRISMKLQQRSESTDDLGAGAWSKRRCSLCSNDPWLQFTEWGPDGLLRWDKWKHQGKWAGGQVVMMERESNILAFRANLGCR